MKIPKIPTENLFQYILGLSALFVAAMAAFFSVLGIGMLFSGAMISAMLMASSLELGKIVATSFLYRYWDKTTKFLKIYLCTAVAVLVVITSLGVFGWLSSAYQSSAMQHELNQQRVATLVEQRTVLTNQTEMAKKRMDSLMKMRNDQEVRLNEALSNPILSRNPTALRQVQEQNISLIKQTDADISQEKDSFNKLVAETNGLDKRILDTKLENNKSKDVLTFQFVADAVGMDLTTTVKWFIVVIIAVFDPLAVCLILAYNVTLFSGKKGNRGYFKMEDGNEDSNTEEPKVESIPIQPMKSNRILLNEVPVITNDINSVHNLSELKVDSPTGSLDPFPVSEEAKPTTNYVVADAIEVKPSKVEEVPITKVEEPVPVPAPAPVPQRNRRPQQDADVGLRRCEVFSSPTR